MSDTDAQNKKDKKSSSGLVIFMIVLLALLSGSWLYRQQEKNNYEENISSTDQASDDANVTSAKLDIKSLSQPRTLGDVNAPVKISEHSSFSCPHCAKFHATNFKKIKSEYIDTGKAYLVFDDFPLRKHDVIVGSIARCVPDDSYFKFVQLVFATQDDWSRDKDYVSQIKEKAVMAGADPAMVSKCASSKDLQEALAMRGKKAHGDFGISSTPTLIINDDQKIGGLAEYAKIKKIIDGKIEDAENDKVVDEIAKTEDTSVPSETAKVEPSEGGDNPKTSENSDETEFDLKKAATPRILGDVNAPVKIVEHSSFSCPHCAKYHREVFPKLKAQYIDTGKAYLIYDDFPLGGPDVIIGALARCVPEDSYFKFVQFIFEKQDEWKKSSDYLGYLKQNAMLTGATSEELQRCVDSTELRQILAERGQNAYKYKGVSGTPTIIINDNSPISALSPYPEIKIMIDDILRELEE